LKLQQLPPVYTGQQKIVDTEVVLTLCQALPSGQRQGWFKQLVSHDFRKSLAILIAKLFVSAVSCLNCLNRLSVENAATEQKPEQREEKLILALDVPSMDEAMRSSKS